MNNYDNYYIFMLLCLYFSILEENYIAIFLFLMTFYSRTPKFPLVY
jgi:hypothetical protein